MVNLDSGLFLHQPAFTVAFPTDLARCLSSCSPLLQQFLLFGTSSWWWIRLIVCACMLCHAEKELPKSGWLLKNCLSGMKSSWSFPRKGMLGACVGGLSCELGFIYDKVCYIFCYTVVNGVCKMHLLFFFFFFCHQNFPLTEKLWLCWYE